MYMKELCNCKIPHKTIPRVRMFNCTPLNSFTVVGRI